MAPLEKTPAWTTQALPELVAVTGLLAVAYLVLVFHTVVLTKIDYWAQPVGSVQAVLLVAGWFGVRKRVHAIHSTAPTLKQ